MFIYKTKIRLHDTDAGGIIFFANQFKIVHDASEDLLEKSGMSFQKIFKKTNYFLPIVHAESDYKAPIHVGDKITVAIKVDHVGQFSFSFEYTLKRGKILVGTAKIMHVAINRNTRKKIPLSRDLRLALEQFQR